MPFISISAPSIVSGMSGESEKTLRDTFEEAKVCNTFTIPKIMPCLVLFAESCSLSAIYRRDRCYHAQARKCAKGDGTTNSSTVFNVYGWYV